MKKMMMQQSVNTAVLMPPASTTDVNVNLASVEMETPAQVSHFRFKKFLESKYMT